MSIMLEYYYVSRSECGRELVRRQRVISGRQYLFRIYMSDPYRKTEAGN